MIFSQKGVALIQVLLMTAIMSLIAIQFSKTAREQVRIANLFSDRLDAELSYRTARANVLAELFSHDAEELSDRVVGNTRWNLRGQTFSINQRVEAQIQAHSGLLSLSLLERDKARQVLLHMGADETLAQEIVDSIGDWVDVNNNVNGLGAETAFYRTKGITAARNGPMQHISELAMVKGMTPELYQKLAQTFTIYSTSTFNPALAPPETIDAIFTADMAQNIRLAQQNASQRPFDEQVWFDMGGYAQGEMLDIHPRSLFRVTLIATVTDVRLTRTFDVFVQSQRAKDPLVILAKY